MLPMAHRAYIGIGSNLGDRHANIERALAELASRAGIRVMRVASRRRTAPVDCPPGSGDFINTAAEVETSLSPEALLQALLAVERLLGRAREENCRNAPRTIDLDVLLYDDLAATTPGLTIPHPRMTERDFVLRPLVELDPALTHPVLGVSVAELLKHLGRKRNAG